MNGNAHSRSQVSMRAAHGADVARPVTLCRQDASTARTQRPALRRFDDIARASSRMIPSMTMTSLHSIPVSVHQPRPRGGSK